jgi:hypothetical protein
MEFKWSLPITYTHNIHTITFENGVIVIFLNNGVRVADGI